MKKTDSTPTKKATAALRDAVDKVIDEHRARNRPLAVWQDGRVVMLPPNKAMTMREECADYAGEQER